jgi:hypothetical protein
VATAAEIPNKDPAQALQVVTMRIYAIMALCSAFMGLLSSCAVFVRFLAFLGLFCLCMVNYSFVPVSCDFGAQFVQFDNIRQALPACPE